MEHELDFPPPPNPDEIRARLAPAPPPPETMDLAVRVVARFLPPMLLAGQEAREGEPRYSLSWVPGPEGPFAAIQVLMEVPTRDGQHTHNVRARIGMRQAAEVLGEAFKPEQVWAAATQTLLNLKTEVPDVTDLNG